MNFIKIILYFNTFSILCIVLLYSIFSVKWFACVNEFSEKHGNNKLLKYYKFPFILLNWSYVWNKIEEMDKELGKEMKKVMFSRLIFGFLFLFLFLLNIILSVYL